MSLALNEQQRMTYLSAIGVDMYVPRWVLPGAKASVQAKLPVVAVPDVLSARRVPGQAHVNPEHEASATRPALDALFASQNPGQNMAAQSVRNTVDTVAARASEPHQGTVQFTLNVWPVSRSVLVVDSHQPKSALPTVALLRNMLKIKGLSGPLPGVDTLQWPLFTDVGGFGASALNGLAQAQDMVRAFLQSRLEASPVQSVWVMGADAYQAMAVSDVPFAQSVGKAIDMPALGCLALVMPSLKDMLVNPNTKMAAWQAIAPYALDS